MKVRDELFHCFPAENLETELAQKRDRHLHIHLYGDKGDCFKILAYNDASKNMSPTRKMYEMLFTKYFKM